MGRLAWALLLALGAHILFFRMIVPESMLQQADVIGSGQITVSIFRSARESPAADISRSEPDQEPLPVPAVAEEPAEMPVKSPPATESESPQLQPEQTEIVPPAEAVPAAEGFLKHVPAPEQNKTEKAGMPATSAAEGKAEGSETLAAETVRQALPLTIHNRPPAYPPLARRRGWEGKVVLEVEVQEDGMVKSVRVAKSSTYSLLDQAALEAVEKWRFQPGTRDGEPLTMKVLVPVHFVLKDAR